MMTRSLPNILGAAAALACASPAGAQHWRTLDASRQLHDTSAVTVRVAYGAGRIDLRPTTGPLLYQMSLRYDAERTEPLSRYDSAARTLSLGIRSHNAKFPGRDNQYGSLRAELSPKVPMELELELGATEGDVQLGGLRITDLSLKGGAADLTLRFDERNPERMKEMRLDVGAAAVKVRRAGNSGVERVRANVGAGSLELDLGGGALSHDVDVNATVAVGEFKLHVPPDVGVFVEASTFLASFKKAGLVKRDDGWYTSGYAEAERKVRVRLRVVLGGFTLAHSSR